MRNGVNREPKTDGGSRLLRARSSFALFPYHFCAPFWLYERLNRINRRASFHHVLFCKFVQSSCFASFYWRVSDEYPHPFHNGTPLGRKVSLLVSVCIKRTKIKDNIRAFHRDMFVLSGSPQQCVTQFIGARHTHTENTKETYHVLRRLTDSYKQLMLTLI